MNLLLAPLGTRGLGVLPVMRLVFSSQAGDHVNRPIGTPCGPKEAIIARRHLGLAPLAQAATPLIGHFAARRGRPEVFDARGIKTALELRSDGSV